MPTQRWVPFGVLTRAHGVRGELRLVPHHSGDDLPTAIARVLVTSASGQERTYDLEGARATNDAWIVRLAGVADRDQAAALRGNELHLHSDDLPPLADGELYLYELVGAQVVDERDASTVGTVREVLDNQGQDLLRIEAPRGEQRLLPLAAASRCLWDRNARVLTVAVPEGLWEP